MDKENKLIYLNVLLSGLGVPIPDKMKADSKSAQEMRDAAAKITKLQPKGSLSNRPLESILASINDAGKTYRFSPQKLNIDLNEEGGHSAVFPEENPNSAIDGLKSKLKQELDLLAEIEDENSCVYTAFSLVEAYGSRIAYEGEEEDGTSVFDHNRLLAGVTHCLSLGLQDKEIKEKDEMPFYLIKGAVSGIQDFIYSYVNKDSEGQKEKPKDERPGMTKNLAKLLRGRSFYVALLTDFVAEYFCEELGLERGNMIFSGGGHFLLVAPRNKNIKQKIAELDKAINLMLLKKLGPRLSFVVAAEPCGEDLFSESTKHYKNVNAQLSEKKKQKHQDYLEKVFAQKSKEKYRFKADLNLGRNLPKKEFLIQVKFDDYNLADLGGNEKLFKWHAASFEEFGVFFFLGKDKEDITQLLGHLKKLDNISSVRIIRMNSTEFLTDLSSLANGYKFPIAFGFRFVGKFAPTNDKGVVPFEDLIEYRFPDLLPDKKRERQSSLAVMRLDVDDLGFLFGNGFTRNKSFVRLAALSREFHLFFGGYFNTIAAKYNVYVTYSGGDDAFVVGSWYNILLFAEALQADFEKFTCENPHIHFSAGIMTCNVHHPIARFAFETEDLLDIAKDFEETKADGKSEVVKNAIHVFNKSYSWEGFKKMLAFGRKLGDQTNMQGEKDKSKFNRSLIHRLLQIIQSGRDDDYSFYRNISVLHYHLARRGFTRDNLDKKKAEAASEIVEDLLKDFACKQTIEDYLLPTQFVLLKTRK